MRFNARVPFENASKILRDREIADVSRTSPGRPRSSGRSTSQLGTRRHVLRARGRLRRAAAALGFRTRRLLGQSRARLRPRGAGAWRRRRGRRSRTSASRSRRCCAAGAERVETARAELAIAPTRARDRGRVGRRRPRGPALARALLGDGVQDDGSRSTGVGPFGRARRFLTRISMRRDLDNRSVSYADGGSCAWTTGTRACASPLARPRRPRRTAVRALRDRTEILARRLRASCGRGRRHEPDHDRGDADGLPRGRGPSRGGATRRIATPAGYRAAGGERRGGRLRGADGGGIPPDPRERPAPRARTQQARPPAVDEVAPEPAALRMRLERRTGRRLPARSSYGAETRGGKTYLMRGAAPGGSREDLLRNDSMRGRLAGIARARPAGLGADALRSCQSSAVRFGSDS